MQGIPHFGTIIHKSTQSILRSLDMFALGRVSFILPCRLHLLFVNDKRPLTGVGVVALIVLYNYKYALALNPSILLTWHIGLS